MESGSGATDPTMASLNDSFYDYDVDESASTFFLEDVVPTAIVYALTLFLGIAGNSLIIFTIVRHSRMRTITNVFLASLASADLLLILICVPVKMAKLFSFSWSFGEFLCKFVHYMQNVSAISSVLTLTSMSLERYYAILHPMKAKYLCTISQARKVIAVIWGLSFALATPIIFVQVHMEVGHRIKAFWCVHAWDAPALWRFYTVYMFLLVLAIPSCVMGFAYASICREVWQVMKARATMIGGDSRNGNGSQTREMQTLSVNTTSKSRRNRISRTGFTIDDDYNTVKQVIKMLVAVVVLFVICWAPLMLTEVLTSFQHLHELNYGYLKHMRMTFHLMAYCNSCINPIVYGFMSKNFRKSFMDALCLCRHGRNHRSRQMSFTNTRNTSVTLARSLSVSTTA